MVLGLSLPFRFRTSGAINANPNDESTWDRENPFGTVADSGTRITHDNAETISAVYACKNVLAQDESVLPLNLFRRIVNADGTEGKERATDHPLFTVLRFQSNEDQTALEFRSMMMGHLVLRGNAFAQIFRNGQGQVVALVPLHPDRVKVERLENGRIRFKVRGADNRERTLVKEEVFHLKFQSVDGLVGRSVVTFARDSMGLALGGEKFGSARFSQDGTPKGILKNVSGALNEEQRIRLRDSWNAASRGLNNAGKTALLEEGLEWQQIGLNAEDMQFLGLREFQVLEIARWFRMQPHKIMVQNTQPRANVEQSNIEHVTNTMLYWFVLWEQAISRDLIMPSERDNLFAEHLVDALLRGDTPSRFEAYNLALNGGGHGGWMTINEVRVRENMNPFEGEEFNRPLLSQTTLAEPEALVQLPAPSAEAQAQVALLALEASKRVVRKETRAATQAARRYADDPEGWKKWAAKFYGEHAAHLSKELNLDTEAATKYAERQRDDLIANGIGTIETWEAERPQELADLMIGALAA